MVRAAFWLLLCLPICLLLAPDRYRPLEPAEAAPSPEEGETFASVADAGAPLPDDAAMLDLAGRDPVAFLEWCIRRCHREVRGCRLVLRKHEILDGDQHLPEVVAVDYQVAPTFGVLFHWVENPPNLASAVLYAPDLHPDELLCRPVGLLAVGGNVLRPVRGEQARKSGRYSLEEFGFENVMRRTLGSWRKAARENALHVEFLGIQERPEVGGRRCYVFHRTKYLRPEEKDGIADLLIAVDCETWLQTVSVLKDSSGRVLGSYAFTEVDINPAFRADRFTAVGLRRPPPAGLER